ncbi:MAG: hypothetical protein WCK77_23185 [Verrucomicrobiota bacterium]
MNYEASILEVLARSVPNLVRELALRNRLELEMGVTVSLAFLSFRLRGLEASGDIIAVDNQDTGTKWTISDKGKARLAAARE